MQDALASHNERGRAQAHFAVLRDLPDRVKRVLHDLDQPGIDLFFLPEEARKILRSNKAGVLDLQISVDTGKSTLAHSRNTFDAPSNDYRRDGDSSGVSGVTMLSVVRRGPPDSGLAWPTTPESAYLRRC